MLGLTSLLNSIHTLIPLLSDSSLKSVIPSIFLSLASSAIFCISFALLTMYGSSVTTILFLPFAIGSMSVTALTLILPRPVLYASLIPIFPIIVPPVGKSGPLIICITSSSEVSLSCSILLSIIFTTASITSLKL